MFVLGAGPVWIVSAAILLSIWPWQYAVEHLIVLAIVFHGFPRLPHRISEDPFTCSFLSGKTYIHMAFLTALALVFLLTWGVRFESKALDDRNLYTWLVGILLVAAIAAHPLTAACHRSLHGEGVSGLRHAAPDRHMWSSPERGLLSGN